MTCFRLLQFGYTSTVKAYVTKPVSTCPELPKAMYCILLDFRTGIDGLPTTSDTKLKQLEENT